MHAARFPVSGSKNAVMPRFWASRPVRSGVDCAVRRSAAVDVLFRAGLEGICANRSGRGVFVDLMVRTVVCDGLGEAVDNMSIEERVDEGNKKDWGERPQLRGALGGIVMIVFAAMG